MRGIGLACGVRGLGVMPAESGRRTTDIYKMRIRRPGRQPNLYESVAVLACLDHGIAAGYLQSKQASVYRMPATQVGVFQGAADV